MSANTTAYDLLSQQAASACAATNWREVVISAIRDDTGKEHILSRLGDREWNLSPFFPQSNVSESQKCILWPDDLPTTMVDDCKRALYGWYVRGRPGVRPPSARTIIECYVNSRSLLYSLRDLGISAFDQVRPIHVSNYVQSLKKKNIAPAGMISKLKLLDILWVFREDTVHRFRFYPWGKLSLQTVSGPEGAYSSGKTPIIPRSVQNTLFQYCEQIIGTASKVFAKREAGLITMASPELIRIRDAALYLISISSGMRNEEVIGIEIEAGRTEERNGVFFHWIRSVEHKTGKGVVEYLVPEMALHVLKIAEAYSAPLRRRLADEIAQLEAELNADEGIAGNRKSHLLTRLHKARRDVNRIFLAWNRKGPRIAALTSGGTRLAFTALASRAGVQWELSPHQCRRTYARLWVESKMGRRSLIFIKWQFKHTSMGMSELYASNPSQDSLLFDEILSETFEFKHELLVSLVDGDRLLSGGGGRKIVRMRAQAVKNRELLLRQTAQEIRIRPTGHGWCISLEEGCGGGGLYDPPQCGDCRNGIIDPDEHGEIWKGLYEQQKELVDIDDCGPVAQARSQLDLARIKRVIDELGVSVDDGGSVLPSNVLGGTPEA